MLYLRFLIHRLPDKVVINYKNESSEGQTIVSKKDIKIEDGIAVYYDGDQKNILDINTAQESE